MRPVLALLLFACTPPGDLDGEVLLCFADEDVVDEPAMEAARHEATGTVLGVGTGPGTPCPQSSRAVIVQKENGSSAWLGWTVRDPDGADVTPDLTLQSGEQVSIVHDRSVSWAGEHDTAALIGENGLWLAAKDWSAEPLAAVDMAGLEVAVGDDVGSARSADCGSQQAYATEFQGVSVRQGERRVVTVGEAELSAWNVASWRYEQTRCTDTWGPWQWITTR
ncbi:MAG: hypothetical protein KC912_04680 [Proteobacteria bacterium]|nr:hypothetical protein [Pseudomonadota bacterium]